MVAVVVAARQGDPWKIVSFSIYGTTYFCFLRFPRCITACAVGRSGFHKLDHYSIYFLIAGTYPFYLGDPAWWLGLDDLRHYLGFGGVGVVLESLPQKGNRVLSLVVYVLMGWLVLVALKPLLQKRAAGAGFAWLLAGGLFYTGGLVSTCSTRRSGISRHLAFCSCWPVASVIT